MDKQQIIEEIKREIANRTRLYKEMKNYFNKENYKGCYKEGEREKAYVRYVELYYELKDLYEEIEQMEKL